MDEAELLNLMYGQQVDPFSIDAINSAASSLPPVSRVTMQQSRKGPTGSNALANMLQAKQLESFRDQQAGIKAFEQGLAQQGSQAPNAAVAIASGLSDFFAGTNNLAQLQDKKDMQEQMDMRNKTLLQGMKKDLTKSEIDLLENQFKAAQESEQFGMKTELDREKLALMKNRLATASQVPKLLPGQEAADREFGKEYQEWNAQGGYAGLEKQLAQLEAAATALESPQGEGMTGGTLEAWLPGGSSDAARARVKPEAFALQQGVEQAIQASLRQTLGSQFTEKEGAQVIARSFDPRLPAKTNAAKIRAEIENIRRRGLEKDRASKYFEQTGGTLKGLDATKRIAPTAAPTSQPKEGDTRDWQGKTFNFTGGQWVEKVK